jgi:phosphoribosylformylglycinamidine synthase
LTTPRSSSEQLNGRQPGGRTYLVEVLVEPKPGVNDPQGEAIYGGLRSLGYDGVAGVRAGRYFQVTIQAPDLAAATAVAESMCDRLLANPVIERYRVDVREVSAGADERREVER